jgi:hypothetical protein
VMITDVSSSGGSLLAGNLARRGHRIHSCKLPGQSSGCAVLAQRPCPLECEPVDVVVCTGGPLMPRDRGDGATCAVTHRVPLVMVDACPDDPLIGFAASLTVEGRAVTDVESVAASPLLVHSAIARGVVRAELERRGVRPTDSEASVEVSRRSGALFVEFWYGAQLSRSEAESVSTHVVQSVREHDRWARGVDVVLHDLSGRLPDSWSRKLEA